MKSECVANVRALRCDLYRKSRVSTKARYCELLHDSLMHTGVQVRFSEMNVDNEEKCCFKRAIAKDELTCFNPTASSWLEP